MFKYWMEKNKMIPIIIDIVMQSASELNEDKKKAKIKEMLLGMVSDSKFLFYCLKNYKKNKKWVFDVLTIVDFFFYEVCFYIKNFF